MTLKEIREWKKNAHSRSYPPPKLTLEIIECYEQLIDRARPLVEWIANECDDAFDCMNNTHERARQWLKDTEEQSLTEVVNENR